MAPALGILCYHRIVADDEIEHAWPYLERGTAVRLATFRAHLERIAEFADIVSERAALDVLAGRMRLERPAIWLTFDDGYRDTLRALPLADAGTVFVTTSIWERALPADDWYAVLLGATRPRGLIDLGSGAFEYDLGHREGRARLVHGPERHRYLRAPPSTRASILRSLAEQLRADIERPRCYLSPEQLRGLRGAGWSVGSHGLTHAPFDELAPDAIKREAWESKTVLSALGCEVRSLALPDGSAPRDPAAVLAAGYECVLGLGSAPADRAALVHPRFIVPDDPSWIDARLRPRIA